ncbi:unnamed protein product [Menidia menidia]|uniref:(Atlantic silverside) hypothetical protein n=1 Tax=Menidia menidia TaxID=238744 RepID=A0A8S4BSX8_9TELE|nr:unnamed protein product [Menidia menidia]
MTYVIPVNMAKKQRAKTRSSAGKTDSEKQGKHFAMAFESSDEEAPEEVTFEDSKVQALRSMKHALDTAKREREELKEKRRRRQELFQEQKKRKLLSADVLAEIDSTPSKLLLKESDGEGKEAPTEEEQEEEEQEEEEGGAQEAPRRRRGARKKKTSGKGQHARTKNFIPRPVLVRNTMFAELLEDLKKTGLRDAPADHCYAGPEDVACDVCSGRKLRAIKSCLSCVASYCEEHLQPHYESPPLKKHKLVEPSKKLQENICSVHDEVKKLFCRTDQKSICSLCSVEEHKGHHTVSVAAERTERQRELEGRRQQIQQRIQDKQKDVKLLQQEVEAIDQSADKTVEDSGKMFTELIRLIQKSRSDVEQQVRSQQQTAVRGVKELQQELQQEITELQRKDAELQQLSHTEDHIHYCMNCIKAHFDGEDQKGVHSCPQCRESFIPKPVLVKNTMLAALVEQLKKTGLQPAPADHCYAGLEDVACDVCSGRKLRASKSCLVCVASYCQEHLQPHYESPPLKKHKLVEPSKKLQENICSVHDEVKKMFCRTDQKSICLVCAMEEHKGHHTVSAAAERTERQRELKGRRQQIQQRLQDKQKDVDLLQQEVEAIDQSADKTVEDSEKMFTELIRLIQNRRSDVEQQVRSQQQTAVRGVKELQQELQQEITELQRKDAELQQLSHTEDDNEFIQKYSILTYFENSVYFLAIQSLYLQYFGNL